MKYSTIVFDTAPTGEIRPTAFTQTTFPAGHTLRLLSFPSVLERAFDKFGAIKDKFAGIFKQASFIVSFACAVMSMIRAGASDGRRESS